MTAGSEGRRRTGGAPRRVVVAMSGGVDSAVAAALLQEAGWEVLGVTLRLGADPSTSCCDLGSLDSAREAARVLGIPHEVWPVAERFEREVLLPAWRDYDQGRTPNPCIWCNARLKFPVLLASARQRGYAAVATGHYARLEPVDPVGPAGRCTAEHQSGAPEAAAPLRVLRRGRDPRKDQSYFLYGLGPSELAAVCFPLGHMSKPEVRAVAAARHLPCHDRPESQDACLVSSAGSFAEALRKRFGGTARPGAILDEQGRVLGEHAGIHFFTLGQRKGTGVAMGRRAYVSEIHPAEGQVVLSSRPEALLSWGCSVEQMHWLPGVNPGAVGPVQVQVRYRSAAVDAQCSVRPDGGVEIRFAELQRAVTPGQAAVLYDGDRVLGGGPIDAVFRVQRAG